MLCSDCNNRYVRPERHRCLFTNYPRTFTTRQEFKMLLQHVQAPLICIVMEYLCAPPWENREYWNSRFNLLRQRHHATVKQLTQKYLGHKRYFTWILLTPLGLLGPLFDSPRQGRPTRHKSLLNPIVLSTQDHHIMVAGIRNIKHFLDSLDLVTDCHKNNSYTLFRKQWQKKMIHVK